MAVFNNVPTYIKPSSEELALGKLTAQNLEAAIRALHLDGLVIIEDVYKHEDLDMINKVMVKDALKMAELGDEGPKNFHRGNLSITPPPQRQYFTRNLFLNPIVSQVTSAHLGPKPKWTFNSANAALPSGKDTKIPALSQPTHTDAYFDHPRHPFADVISVPLISMDAHNGATEVWLGTHTMLSGPEVMFGASRESDEVGVAKKYLDERREKGFGPLQPPVAKGSAVIRDIRLWHGGKPNFSDEIRIMLGQSEFCYHFSHSRSVS
jgi:ectoine hydroxylase-related dioxygenase (phytanoyl-CoA dioxygenase family)